jgi:hypothetical protein
VVYGHDPPALPTYNRGEAKVESVGTALQERDQFLQEVREHLLQAQQGNNAARSTTMSIIGIRPLMLVSGSGCAFTTGKLLHCQAIHVAS